MSKNPTPLALPWPAWHTDEVLASRHLRELSDRDLKRADDEHDYFCGLHSSWYKRAPHYIPRWAEQEASAVGQLIQREEASRFRAILHQRDLSAIRASFSRQCRREKLRREKLRKAA